MFIDAAIESAQPQTIPVCLALAATPLLVVSPLADGLPVVFYRRSRVGGAASVSEIVEPGAHGIFCPLVAVAHQCGAHAQSASLAVIKRGNRSGRGDQ